MALSGWTYRQSHIITSSSILSDYQLQFTVYKTIGTSSGSNIYCNNHCNDDFSDTSYRIVNLRDGVAANDAVNLKQLSTVAAGITYIDSCAGRYNTPPTGTDVPRLLVGPSPSGIIGAQAAKGLFYGYKDYGNFSIVFYDSLTTGTDFNCWTAAIEFTILDGTITIWSYRIYNTGLDIRYYYIDDNGIQHLINYNPQDTNVSTITFPYNKDQS